MVTTLKLSKNDDSTKVNQTLYTSMIGNLQYVVHSRPDITLAMWLAKRFSANRKENQLMAMKSIMRYLKGTKEFGVYYKKNEKFDLRS